MHGFFSNLTAALLAMHTVLGCCGHHAHGCTRECISTSAVGSPDGDRHACADDSAAGCCGNHDHHGLHVCQGNTCVFVGPTKLGSHRSALQRDLPPVACVVCAGPTAHSAEQCPVLAIDALLPRLRLHLAHHVLLL